MKNAAEQTYYGVWSENAKIPAPPINEMFITEDEAAKVFLLFKRICRLTENDQLADSLHIFKFGPSVRSNSTGGEIMRRRKLKGLSQKQLAELIGVHQTAISQWERGELLPSTECMIKLLPALDCRFEDLIVMEKEGSNG